MSRVGPGYRIAMAPDRPRPGRVAFPAPDHMDMELRHHIAQRADIELFHPRQHADQVRQFHDLGHQLDLVARRQIGDLHHAGAARHQQAPVIAGVVVEKEPAERPVGQRHVRDTITGSTLKSVMDYSLSKRRGSNSGMTCPLPRITSAISCAMAGVNRMPLRYWPLATNRPGVAGRPQQRQAVRAFGTQARPVIGQPPVRNRGHQLRRPRP